MSGESTWREALAFKIPPELSREIDTYETELELRRQGKLEEKLFNEIRLRRGVYGQRYDNGRRHDGVKPRALAYPAPPFFKGPDTLWDAPGMQRIKIPFGSVSAEQMDLLAELADDYSDGILHVTTRQDFQLHFVHIDDTPDLMRRLAAVGITTREACGNSVRNVTACPLAGVCRTEGFDVTGYARALSYFLLGHPDAQDFGRKFKIAFSGCAGEPCGLTSFHDLGFIAKTRDGGGGPERGFEFYAGGGLGAVPHQAKLFDSFLPEGELLPVSQAVCRVFARLGEKKNRARARLKFLVASLGIEEFRRLVLEERKTLPFDPRWREYLSDAIDGRPPRGTFLHSNSDRPPQTPEAPFEDLPGFDGDGYAEWTATNVRSQRQPGYAVVHVTLPLGDLSSTQMRSLAELARRFGDGGARTSVDQNLIFRFVPEAALPALHAELLAIGLSQPGAGTIVDVTSCPGTDTCKLGIASSRGLAGELRARLLEGNLAFDRAAKDLHIKVSGCFNSCGQHHLADIGFYGVSRKTEGRTVPHFQVVLGGQWSENGKSFGLAIGAVPAKRVPEALGQILDFYRAGAEPGERFQTFVKRTGKANIRAILDTFAEIPTYERDRGLYSDWGDPREFTLGDLGRGECAGEVISRFEFGLAASEREVFEAQILLEEENDADGAAEKAYRAMLVAAEALVRLEDPDAAPEPDRIVEAFRTRFCDTKLFFDPFAGGKFAHYFFRAHEEKARAFGEDEAHRRIEEAQLFIEATHGCHARRLEWKTAAAAT